MPTPRGYPVFDSEKEAVRPGAIVGLSLNERLHVPIGAGCNNNCVFCMEDDRQGRRERLSRLLPEDVRAILEANVFRKEMMFVSGEPTLHPQFLRFVRWARELGYAVVGVISNGRRFSYRPFAEKAIRAGLNYAILSIHGPDARTHNALTRTPGAFEQAIEGVRNLHALRRPGAFDLHTSTVINRRNMAPERMQATYDLLAPHVDLLVFNTMQPFGRGEQRFEALMPRYREVAQAFADFTSQHPPGSLRVALLDLPYCTTEGYGIPDRNRGYVERYVHFERAPDTTAELGCKTDLDALDADITGGATAKHAHRMQTEGLDPSLVAHHRDGQDVHTRAKRAECRECVYFDVCDGVWRSYLARHGWEEFEPVKRPATSVGPVEPAGPRPAPPAPTR